MATKKKTHPNPKTAKNPCGAGRHIDPKLQARFLELYQEIGTVNLAAKQTPIAKKNVYLWVKNNPEFAKAFNEIKPLAKESYVGILEQEAHRRAVEGVDEPVYHKGYLVAKVRRYSDTLLIFLLKGAAPEKYRDHTDLNVSGKDGQPLSINFIVPSEKAKTLTQKALAGETPRGT